MRLRRPAEPSPASRAELALGDLRVRRAIRLAEATGDTERLVELARAYGVDAEALVAQTRVDREQGRA